MTTRFRLTAFAAIAIVAAGCTSLQRNYDATLPGSPTTPSPNPQSSATAPPPSACATEDPTATQIAMVTFITATPDPTYGIINGYAPVENGNASVVAQVVQVSAGTAIQFVNGEQPGSPSIVHSAVGFPRATEFPAIPYNFTAASAGAIGTQISPDAWSTGRIDPGCYSTPLSASQAGTYFFGDYDYYNLSNMRDVLIVSGTSS